MHTPCSWSAHWYSPLCREGLQIIRSHLAPDHLHSQSLKLLWFLLCTPNSHDTTSLCSWMHSGWFTGWFRTRPVRSSACHDRDTAAFWNISQEENPSPCQVQCHAGCTSAGLAVTDTSRVPSQDVGTNHFPCPATASGVGIFHSRWDPGCKAQKCCFWRVMVCCSILNQWRGHQICTRCR